MKLDVIGDKLVLKASALWARAMGIWALLVGWFVATIFMASNSSAGWIAGVIGPLFATGFGLIFLLQPDVAAEFDLRARKVTVWRRSLVGAVRYVAVAFQDVAYIGLVKIEDAESGISYAMEMIGRDGVRYPLSVLNGRGKTFGELLSIIAEATGIERRDYDSGDARTRSRGKPDWQSL